MIHQYNLLGLNIVLDVYSGSVHVVDEVAYDAIAMFENHSRDQIVAELLSKYADNVKIVSILMAFAATVYFPMCWFVRLALPAYEYSLGIFRIVLPGLILSSSITVVMHNYFKTLEQNMKFFVLSLTVLILSLVSGLGSYYIFHTMEAVSWASVIIMIVWYVLSERFLKKQYGISSGVNLIYLIITSMAFYVISLMDKWYIGMAAYIGAAFIITLLFYAKEIKRLAKYLQ